MPYCTSESKPAERTDGRVGFSVHLSEDKAHLLRVLFYWDLFKILLITGRERVFLKKNENVC